MDGLMDGGMYLGLKLHNCTTTTYIFAHVLMTNKWDLKHYALTLQYTVPFSPEMFENGCCQWIYESSKT